jgi:uncharacterized metal-binding protein
MEPLPDSLPVIYACSGCSDAGELAEAIAGVFALRVQGDGLAE